MGEIVQVHFIAPTTLAPLCPSFSYLTGGYCFLDKYRSSVQ